MTEPTHSQHIILEVIEQGGPMAMTGKEDDIELYWELVRSGYLNNLCLLMGEYEWKFVLTDKAKEYLERTA